MEAFSEVVVSPKAFGNLFSVSNPSKGSGKSQHKTAIPQNKFLDNFVSVGWPSRQGLVQKLDSLRLLIMITLKLLIVAALAIPALSFPSRHSSRSWNETKRSDTFDATNSSFRGLDKRFDRAIDATDIKSRASNSTVANERSDVADVTRDVRSVLCIRYLPREIDANIIHYIDFYQNGTRILLDLKP